MTESEVYEVYIRSFDFVTRLLMIAKNYKSTDEITAEDINFINKAVGL
jgi:hypothetical protein